MQLPQASLWFLALFGCHALAAKTDAEGRLSPLEATFRLMDELTVKIKADAEKEEKGYREFYEWCDDASKQRSFEITTYTGKKGKLEAKIVELSEDSEAALSKIEDLVGRIAESEKDLAAAGKIFKEQTSDFEKAEEELVETVDTLSRAITILEKEVAKNPGSFAQLGTSGMEGMLAAIATVTEAAGLMAMDRQKLTALLQAHEDDADSDEDVGSPKAADYKTHSSGVLDVLDDMKEKAENDLNELRVAFGKTKQDYAKMKQALEMQMEFDKKEHGEEKTAKAEAEEGKATAEKNLGTTTKLLADSRQGLADTQRECMSTASEHDTSIRLDKEELQVIAKARKILEEASSSLVQQTPEQATQDDTQDDDEQADSFVQLASKHKAKHHAKAVAGQEVIVAVTKLAKDHHSKDIAQLASRISAMLEFGQSAGEKDVFAKVKGLIEDLIAKLEKELSVNAAEKAYCDEQMSKTAAKQEELEDDVDKLNVKIDEDSAETAGLKEDVQRLSNELSELSKEQSELDLARDSEHKAYIATKADLGKGLTAVRKALGVLRDYYGAPSASASLMQEDLGTSMQQPEVPIHSRPATGAGTSIISILEVVESDMATNLAKLEQEEAMQLNGYQKITQENEVTKTKKEQDVKFKTQAYLSLDKSLAEMQEQLAATQSELDAVNDYFKKVKLRCIAKPEPYETRAKRRSAEIQGLKEALAILADEAAFAQTHKRMSRARAGHRKDASAFLAPQ